MDALWNLEDKLKVSTKEAIVVLSCTSFLVIGIFFVVATTVFLRKYWSKKRKRSLIHQEPTTTAEPNNWAGGGVKKVLMKSVRWSGVTKMKKWEKESLLLVKNNSTYSPVWKRPILMGEKCELPRFSGLILYDQKGRPVQPVHYQEEPAETAIVTTLRDLLH